MKKRMRNVTFSDKSWFCIGPENALESLSSDVLATNICLKKTVVILDTSYILLIFRTIMHRATEYRALSESVSSPDLNQIENLRWKCKNNCPQVLMENAGRSLVEFFISEVNGKCHFWRMRKKMLLIKATSFAVSRFPKKKKWSSIKPKMSSA